MKRNLDIASALLLLCIFLAGCDRPQPSPPSQTIPPKQLVATNQTSQPNQQVIDKIRSDVAELLKKDKNQIDIAKPLIELGADELDIVEIVMTVEDEFKIEIPDSAIGEKPGEINKTLSIQKLAEIVAKQPKSR